MSWSLSPSNTIVAVVLILWLASAWLSWANWTRRRTRAALAMEGLRFLTMTLIGFTLLKPEFVRKTIQTDPPEIAILTDASDSMKTRDVVADGSSVLQRDEWLDQVRRTNFWRPLETTARVVLQDFAAAPGGTSFASPPALSNTAATLQQSNAPAASADPGTDINAALEQTLQRQRHLKALLLISDGDWNTGRSPISAATAYRARKVPIYTIATGAEKWLPDVVLHPVSAPSYGLLGEQVSVPFKAQSFLPREVRTSITLNSQRGVEARKDIVIPPFGQVQEALVWAPRALGEYLLTLRIPAQQDEYLADNNDQSFRISIRTEKLNVLVVDSLPRWEYRYLRNALSRDPGVAMDCLLYHPDVGLGQGSNYLSAFPATREAISKYDVVFIGDVGIGGNELSAADAELLKGLVEHQGSGLVFLPGARGRQLTLLSTPLKDLLPVIYDEKKPDGVTAGNESNLLLTSTGRRHFLTLLATDENRNESIWKGLPGFYWCAGVVKSRPGADVLAVHSSMRSGGGRLPLLVTRPYGNGEVLFMGTDSAWRWRRGVEDRYHYRFWGQVVRWMSHKRHMAQGAGLRLAFSPENPQISENMFLQATLTDLSAAGGTSPAALSAKVVGPSGKTERIEFSPVEGGWGVYQANFVPQEGGKFMLTIGSDKGGQKLETEIMVSKPQREKLGQPANIVTMREIADVSRGVAGSIHDLGKIVQQISLLPESEPLQQRMRLWASPWWGGFILTLLSVYWVARKVAGLI
jgi:hypothetical protein